MLTKIMLIILIISTVFSLTATVNTWQGDISHAWSTPTNWALNHVPTISEDVSIPDVGDYPYITATGGYTANCNSINIESGARLRIGNGTLNVTDDTTIYGELWMSSADAVINVDNDIIWYSGSTELISYGIIQVAGDWTFEDGCNVTIEPDNTVVFDGSSNQFLYVYDSNSYFANMTIEQTGISAFWIQNVSTYDIQVTGDLNVTNNSILQVQNNTLTVDGTLDIENGSTLYLEHVGGELINNSNFFLNGGLVVGPGDALVHSVFDIGSTGELTIDGGSFVYDVNGGGYCDIYGELDIIDGVFQAEEQIKFNSTATTSITGGLIRCPSIKAEHNGTFEPSGGTVEIQTTNNTMGNIYCSNGNYFYDLNINPVITQIGGATLQTDILVQNVLEITTGRLRLNSHELTVNNDVLIFDRLIMEDPNDVLNAGNESTDKIIWKAGSSDIISQGIINVRGGWEFEDGTYCQIDPGNMVVFGGVVPAGIQNFDTDAQFGSVTIDKTIYIDGLNTAPIKITGDLNVNSGGNFVTQDQSLIVDGIIDIENGGKIQVYQGTFGGYLETNSDFALNGELDIGSGDAMIHGTFDINSTGLLNLSSGSFEYDEGILQNTISGTLNISGGTYQAKESIYITPAGVVTMNDGILRTKVGFSAQNPGNFHPTGGIVEFNRTSSGGGVVTCNNGNYFHDLHVNSSDPNGGIGFGSDILIQNNMKILAGGVNLSGNKVEVLNNVEVYGDLTMLDISDELDIGNDITFYSGSQLTAFSEISEGIIKIAGNWYFNNGTDAQLGIGNTVYLVGSENSYIFCDDNGACFGNLTIDKDTPADMVEVNSNNIIRTIGDLVVTEGMLKIHDQSTLEIGNEFNIYSSFYTQGTSANDAVITKYETGFFHLNVETGGMIGGSYTTFENVGSAGVNIKAGAFLDALYSFNNCTFQNGETGGSLLTIDNIQTVTIDGAEFYAGSRNAAYNVSKTVDAGEINFTNSSGLFDGPDYEDDIYDRIHWMGFTTPAVTTAAISDIEQTTATCGGNVTADGGCSVTARGVCWSTSTAPTLIDDHSSDGSGTGTFVSSLINLEPDTHYYVRAYATNILGTTYGSEQEFDTLAETPPDPPINLTIEITETDVVLTWDLVPDATYNVYSSDDPNDSVENWILEEEDISGTTWNETIPTSKKFYRVTATD